MQNGDSLREDLLIEYNDGMPRLGFETPARVRSIVTQDWRYTVYAGHDWGELYDLRSDTIETRNLWDAPAYQAVRAQMSERLNHHLIGQMDESPRSHRLA